MSIQIRQATNADTAAIVAVVRTVYDEYGFSWDAEDYHADLYDVDAFYAEPSCFWVALLDGSIVGTVGYEEFDRVPGELGGIALHDGKLRAAGTDCSLERLYVRPEGRRHGLGSELSAHVLRRARDRGRLGLEIWSDNRFVDAHRLYARLGAHTVGERICDDPDEAPEWGLFIPLG